jgi:hypothetical protein
MSARHLDLYGKQYKWAINISQTLPLAMIRISNLFSPSLFTLVHSTSVP